MVSCAHRTPASAPVAASQPSSAPFSEFKPISLLPRYEGRIWTLCDPVDPDKGFCLSIAQARELYMRIGEDRAHFKRLAVAAIETQDKALALVDGIEARRMSAVYGGVFGSVGAVVLGVAIGIIFGHYAILKKP